MSASSSAAAGGEADEPLVHAAFNSKATYFVAATASGIRVFSCTRTGLQHAFSKGFIPSPDGGGSRLITADLTHTGMLAAVVFRPEPAAPDADADGYEGDRIMYCSAGLRDKMLRDDISPSSCRAVRHLGNHVVVAGDGKAALHDRSGRAVKLCLEVDTGPNPLGVCALAEADHGKTVVLACPCPAKGLLQVHVWRRGSGGARVDVHAHSSRVVCVALSHGGRLLATASSKGTVVRIFTTADGMSYCTL